MKNHIRDYATEAFRFYAKIGISSDKYKQKIYNDALERQKKEIHSGVSCPTEAAVIRAEEAVDEKLAEINDLEAVEKTIAELGVRSQGVAILKAIKCVYFEDANKEFKKSDIRYRVHKAEINIPASERTIYRWLSKARYIFAVNRGLRI